MTRAIVLLAMTTAFAPGLAMASENDLATIERECAARLSMPGDGCTCLRDRAAKLTEGQQAFVAAVLTRDEAAQTTLMQSMTVGELTEAGMFMTKAPGQCAKAE